MFYSKELSESYCPILMGITIKVMPKVSIIIINYNGEGLTLECLKSLEKQTFKDFEVIVIDNASIDSSLDGICNFIKSSPISSDIQILPLKNNTGFSGGNIEGLKYAKGEYIALLNNDTEPTETWLEKLVRAMDSVPDVGICASKLLLYGAETIDSAGDGFATSFKGFKRGEGESASLYDKPEYIFGVCAGAALYRRTMINEIGFLDDDFFLIHEDTDLNFRAQLYSWNVLFVPDAIVRHKVRSTIGSMSDAAVYYTLRNSEFVRIKNIPFSLFLKCLPAFLLGMVSEYFYFVLKHRHPFIYCKAKIDALRMLPVMLKKRKEIMKQRKVSSHDLKKIMTPVLEPKFLRNKIRKLIFG